MMNKLNGLDDRTLDHMICTFEIGMCVFLFFRPDSILTFTLGIICSFSAGILFVSVLDAINEKYSLHEEDIYFYHHRYMMNH
jgi:hypothetical protein